MDEQPAPAGSDYPTIERADAGPSPSQMSRRAGTRVWRTTGIILLVLLFATAGTALAVQQSRLHSTRADLAALRSSVAAQSARLDALEKSASGQRQSLASVSTQLTTTEARLASTQSEMQSSETRLQADEKQLNLTTAELPPDLTVLAAKVAPSVVLVTCTAPVDGGTGTGFAFAIAAAKGFTTAIITANHVISACSDPTDGSTLTLSSGGQIVAAVVRASDPTDDVAILDTTVALPVLEPSGVPVVGEFLMAIGHPLGNIQANVTSGNVSDVYPTEFLDTAPISSGNSGGPVVDRTGKVVGIVDRGGGAGTVDIPVIENYNISLRLSSLCLKILSGQVCSSLH